MICDTGVDFLPSIVVFGRFLQTGDIGAFIFGVENSFYAGVVVFRCGWNKVRVDLWSRLLKPSTMEALILVGCVVGEHMEKITRERQDRPIIATYSDAQSFNLLGLGCIVDLVK